MIENKTILITGGTGSFGQKCAEILLNNHAPKKTIIYSRDELKQFEMRQRFSKEKYPAIRFFIGDVRDKERLYRAFQGVDYVIHAAALKQISSCEYNPTEAIKTNILGAQNIINVAADAGVKKVVALSTDKAVNPINIYGATKLCSDKLFIAANAFTAHNICRFSVVRYGNVLGSRGSVLGIFFKHKPSGVLPITDKRMTRFWISLEQGVNFVLKAFERMYGGEIFVPKLPSMNILDFAKAVAPECKIKITGIRPGEKIHELMISKEYSRQTVEYNDYYMIKPDTDYWHYRLNEKSCKLVHEEFEYNSKNNDWWLSIDEMREIIKTYKNINPK